MQITRGMIDINVALISCTLLICIEILQSNSTGAVESYKQGVKILENILRHPRFV